jgi:hypothetical protein
MGRPYWWAMVAVARSIEEGRMVSYRAGGTEQAPGPDVYDHTSGLLFCSEECLQAAFDGELTFDGQRLKVGGPLFAEEIDEGDYDQGEWGALCPMCDNEYHSYG